MKKLLASCTAALTLTGTAWVGGTATAAADYQSDRDALCGAGETNDCSITIVNDEPYRLTEGTGSLTVEVEGAPRVTVRLQLYAMIPSEYPFNWDYVDALGTPKAITTDAAGGATATFAVPVLPTPHGAYSRISVQLAGATKDTTRDRPIVNADETQAPHLTAVRSGRGSDQNYLTTVRDGSLEAKLGGGITGDVYGVQIKVGGKWVDISDERPGNGKVGPDGWAVVHADVTGYRDGGYEMRMFNRTREIYDLYLFDFQGNLSIATNIYITPGEHTSAGRKWRTACEPYSQTERCRTEIWSTEVEYRAGKLVKNNGWHFNNLTYKESDRDLWEGNPLATTGTYSINGRKWRTECETFTSGRNGCRSYIVADVVQATKRGNTFTYAMVRKEVFNNIVLFEIPD